MAARARRISRLRRRVVAGAFASFALAWGVIAFHGPMGDTGKSTATASTSATTPSATSPTTTAAPDQAPVVTAQS